MCGADSDSFMISSSLSYALESSCYRNFGVRLPHRGRARSASGLRLRTPGMILIVLVIAYVFNYFKTDNRILLESSEFSHRKSINEMIALLITFYFVFFNKLYSGHYTFSYLIALQSKVIHSLSINYLSIYLVDFKIIYLNCVMVCSNVVK